MESFQPFFETLRADCSSATWSSAVQLVRRDAVRIEEVDDQDIHVRVATHGGLVAPAVTLYPGEIEWECDCSSNEDVCEHVAAAAIAVRAALREGRPLGPQSSTGGRVAYRLTRQKPAGLALEREIVGNDGAQPLKTTLAAIASGRVAGPRFVASPADIHAERALGSRLRGAMPRELLPKLMDALAQCSDVRLDGAPVQISQEKRTPRGELKDAPGGFVLRVGLDPEIDEIFDETVARCGNTLHVMSSGNLTGREREELSRGRFYPDENAAELTTEILPSLTERIPVDIHSRRLPRTTSDAKPRIHIAVARDGDALSVFPTLVYGEPAVARIDAGRLIHLSDTVPIRDRQTERACLGQLRTALGLAAGHRTHFTGDEALAMAEKIELWTGTVEGDAHHAFRRAPALTPHFESTEKGFTLEFQSQDASGHAAAASVDPQTVLRAWRENHSHISLGTGGFAPLPLDWLERFGNRIADLLAARDAQDNVATYALPELGRLCDDLDQPPPLALETLAPLVSGFESLPHAPAPEDLVTSLRTYQSRGVDWLVFLRDAGLGALLADDMGLGKTLQALCALRGRALVVAPTSVLHSWSDEIAMHRPGLVHRLYHGTGRRLDPDADIILTSFAVLRLDIETLKAERWDCVVLDEAQAIKNPESQTAQAAYQLRAEFRIALTGTPVENRLDELWSQLHFLNRGFLGGRKAFLENTASRIARGEPGAAEELRDKLRPFVLRRLKRDVAPELPPRTEITLHIELSEWERQVYDAIRASTRKQVVDQLAEGGNVLAALEALLRLRQAACHPDLVPGQQADTSSKVEVLVERLQQAVEDGHKALVFSQWTGFLDRVEPRLSAADIPFTRLDGSTRDRGAVVKQFQDEQGPPVMLLSLKAGGSGLTLTAADHVFLLDPWWNPAVEDQAADRAHRIGQDRPVLIHRLVAAETVEERILLLQAAKRATADAVLTGTDHAANITRDDLMELLR